MLDKSNYTPKNKQLDKRERRRRKLEERQRWRKLVGELVHSSSQPPTQPQKQPVDCLHQDQVVSVEGERSLDIRKKVPSDTGFRKEPSSGDHNLVLKDRRLEKLVNNIKCICNGSGTLVTECEQFEVDIIVKYDTCDEIPYEDKSEKVSDKIASKKGLGIANLRMVYTSMLNDIGNSGLMRQCFRAESFFSG